MPQKIEIRSEAVQDILTKAPHWIIIWGNTILLLLVFLFFGLSWIIKYPDIIESKALVTSSIPPQKKVAPITGKIDAILVLDQQKVSNNGPLAILENNADFEDVFYLKSIMDTIQIKKSPLLFPLEKTLLLSLGEINTAFAPFESDYINYQLNRELNPYAYKKSANQSSVSQIQLRIKNMKRQKQLEKKTLSIAKSELNRSEKLFKKGTISKQEYENQEAKYINQERNFENMDVSISQLNQSLNEAFKNSKENTISNKMENVRLHKNAVQSFHALKGAIKNWERKYVIKSDVSGTISYMSHFYKNQQVQQGELLFSVIPSELGNFTAKIKAPIQNSGKIKLGQKVHIKLLNYPEAEYGILNGKIASMSPIPDNDGFYLINVNLKRKLITSYNISIPFKTEMSGTAEIVTEDLRLLERLFYQLRNVFY